MNRKYASLIKLIKGKMEKMDEKNKDSEEYKSLENEVEKLQEMLREFDIQFH